MCFHSGEACEFEIDLVDTFGRGMNEKYSHLL